MEPAALAQQHSGTPNYINQIKGQYQGEHCDVRIIFFFPWHDRDSFPKVILTLYTQYRYQQRSRVSLFKSHEAIIYQSVQYCSVQRNSMYYRTNFPASLMRKELSTLLLHNIQEIKCNST